MKSNYLKSVAIEEPVAETTVALSGENKEPEVA